MTFPSQKTPVLASTADVQVQEDDPRQFAGLDRLHGAGAVERLRVAHVVVVGLGGVGSWSVEALARSGVGRLTLIDLDHVAASNINRQIQALQSTLGMAKALALRERITQINPRCEVQCIEEFVEPGNVDELLNQQAQVVLDCTDQVKAKAAMAAFCARHKIAFVMCGAAGGKVDPLRLRTADLAVCTGDRLLANVRYRLRKEYGFAAAAKSTAKKQAVFGISVVFSDEQVLPPQDGIACDTQSAPQGLNCAGYGSSVTVTAPMGFAAAALAIQALLKKKS